MMSDPAPTSTRPAHPDVRGELHHEMSQLANVLETCNRWLVSRREVTVTQSHALMALPDRGAMSMHELSTAMNLAGSTMTRVVDQLVAKGLAERAPDEEDRRIVRVTLTELGREVRAQVLEDYETTFAVVADQVDEEDWPAFRRVLTTIKRNLSDQCCVRPGE